jgi:hypothetical protein
MSPYDTSSPSTAATRLYLIRLPSERRTWWKETSFCSVAL